MRREGSDKGLGGGAGEIEPSEVTTQGHGLRGQGSWETLAKGQKAHGFFMPVTACTWLGCALAASTRDACAVGQQRYLQGQVMVLETGKSRGR